MEDVIKKCKCKRCLYEWWPKKPNKYVKICPRCKSPLWNKDKVNNIGYHNGREESIWIERLEQVNKKE